MEKRSGGGMQLFLQVVGAVVVFVVLLLVLGYFAFRFWIRWKLGPQAAALMKLGVQPIAARVSLVRSEDEHQQDGTASLIADFKAAGYVAVDTFDVPEMEGMRLWAGFHPAEGFAVAVYDHAVLPPWFDLVRVYESLDTDTVTSTDKHDPRHTPPACTTTADPELEPAQAHALLNSMPVRAPVVRVDHRNWVKCFTDAYARVMDHILASGGPDMEALDRNVEMFGGPRDLDEEQKQQALEMSRASHIAALESALIDRFLETGTVTAHEWRNLEPRVVVVHERMDAEGAVELALDFSNWPDAHPPVADLVSRLADTPIELFEAIGEILPMAARYRLLGEVDRPVRGRVYLAPG
ncbi:hypothetical protein [Marilutibacter alkalisoli]|uniref:Uncharacterized protein n=1 Tax=Marilutibacter alkalisoli TaxID=2591633 RepID=A0A514BQB4_9GAMM|nr:hypothetical protein [Lysobacter alkalisoli]QDH69594.1 hypothetical protein FKV23_05445 [Lysobacter alkalisoli]